MSQFLQPQFPKSTPEPNNPNGYMFRQLHKTHNRIDSLKSAHIGWQQSTRFAHSVNKSLSFYAQFTKKKQEKKQEKKYIVKTMSNSM